MQIHQDKKLKSQKDDQIEAEIEILYGVIFLFGVLNYAHRSYCF